MATRRPLLIQRCAWPAMISIGLALLIVAWVAATRPFGAPDEPAHYLRAVGISRGTLLGPRVPYFNAAIPPAEQAWAQKDARGVRVPASLSPPGTLCLGLIPNTGKGSCVQATYTGDYQPLPYLLPAVAIKLSHGWPTALWLARLLAACACMAFLLLAIRASWSGSPWPLLGVLLAITPMVLFVGSVINPSGLEVSAAVAFAAAALRIARDPANSPRWVWILFAASGAATILAWQLGPVFVGIDLLVLATMIGLGGIRSAANRARGSALLAAGVLAAALVAYASWSVSSGLLHSTFRVSPLGHSLVLGIKQLGPVLRQSVGDFGLVAVPVPDAILAGWLLLVLALAIGSLMVGSRRDRALLAAVVALAVAFPVLFYAWIYRFTGFGLQGRYVLPLFVLVPFVAGEALERSGRQLPGAVTEWIPAIAIGAVAVLQLAAWWVSARAAAGAHDSDWFLAHATWKPPLGWWPWTAAAVLGSVSLATPSVLKAWSAVRLMYAVEPEHGARSGSQGR